MRYFCAKYTLAGLIALNVSKSKSSKSVHNTTGESASSQLKREFVAAMKIVHANRAYKRLGVNLEKIKAALVVAFRAMNGALSTDETMLQRPTSARERLEFDIRSSRLASYVVSMHLRVNGEKGKEKKRRKKKKKKNTVSTDDALLEILGVDLDAFFSRKKTEWPEPGALFNNMYIPEFVGRSSDDDDDRARYILESYVDVAEGAQRPPRLVISRQMAAVAQSATTLVEEQEDKVTALRRGFATAFEERLPEAAQLRRTVPLWLLPAENPRDHKCILAAEQVAFCLNKDGFVRTHRLDPTRSEDGGDLKLSCRFCKFDNVDASKNNDAAIRDDLREQMRRASFFECYTLACPVRRAHVFEKNGGCSQCGVTEQQLKEQDSGCYKKYVSAYHTRQSAIAGTMLAAVLTTTTTVVNRRAADKKKAVEDVDDSEPADPLLLESLAFSLAKLYSVPDLAILIRENYYNNNLQQVESYVRMLYSHYLYVKNLSLDTPEHPDPVFSEFVRQNYFDGSRPKKEIKLSALPDYPTSTNPLVLLTRLLQIVYDFSAASAENKALIRMLLTKMAAQRSRHEPFNYMKLRSVYDGERQTDGCLLSQDDSGQKITITHITWGCMRAQQYWMKCLEHWLGYEVTPERLQSYQSYFAARIAPENLVGTVRNWICPIVGNPQSSCPPRCDVEASSPVRLHVDELITANVCGGTKGTQSLSNQNTGNPSTAQFELICSYGHRG
ncbi:hypothetical protein PI125_g19886 [Phytophthora idaei]|nr:hypothetical protein PI125_g19886 [Phytophthora idaei]